MKNNTKKSYSAPRLTVHGNAAELTQANTTGGRFDREFGTIITPGLPILTS